MKFAGFLLLALLLAEASAHAVNSNNQKFHCDVPEDWLIEGERIKNFWPGAKWPGAVVKYELHHSLNDNDRNEVFRAFNDIQSKTCIRFEPRNGDEAYTSIEVDDNVCGLGHLCRTGGYQFAQFGGGCREWNTMVHELGHNLCLGHEQSRKDRDDYVHFDSCGGGEIPGKDMDSDLRGSLYDYGSQMHYQCGWCPGGWPRERGDQRCGRDIQNGLSVLDADKLNDFYDCSGCMSHRWRPIDALSDSDRRDMLQFGSTETGQPLYACRGLIGGEVAMGKYSAEWGVCYLPYGGAEHQYGNRAQVFTWPQGLKEDSKRPTYRVANITELLQKKTLAEPIPSGRTFDGVTGYIAVANIDFEGRREQSIGKVFENDWSRAYFSFYGRELVTSDYGVIVCGD